MSGGGAGYVAYGIYPDYKDYYALHVFFDNIREHKVPIDTLLEKWGTIVHDEQIKTYEQYISARSIPRGGIFSFQTAA